MTILNNAAACPVLTIQPYVDTIIDKFNESKNKKIRNVGSENDEDTTTMVISNKLDYSKID